MDWNSNRPPRQWERAFWPGRQNFVAAILFCFALSLPAMAGNGRQNTTPAAPQSNDSSALGTPSQAKADSITMEQQEPADQVSATSGWIGGLDTDGNVTLGINRSRVLTTAASLRRADRDGAALTEGSSDVATVSVLSPRSLVVTGKKEGSTNLIIEDELGRRQLVEVVVEADLGSLRDQLKTLSPLAQIEVHENSGAIVLKGEVPTLDLADQAVQIATAFAPNGGKVINLLQIGGGQQVMLQVKFAEVSKTVESQLGVNFGYTDGQSIFGQNVAAIPFTLGSSSLLATDPLAAALPAANTLLGNIRFNASAFDYFVNCLRQDDLVRTLAEPTLVALSGETASFQAGGEIPIPVPQSGSGSSSSPVITIQYQPYGILLHFTPVVMGDGRIRLKIDPEVSALDKSNSVETSGFNIPALTTRSVDTTVELADGQTFTIAGLLNDQVSGTTTEIPGASDIPILGALFRSVSYQRNQTELVVMVTPHLVEGINPDQVTSAPGEHWRYPSEADLFFFRDLGGEIPPQATGKPAMAVAPQFRGEYGFVPTNDTSVVEH